MRLLQLFTAALLPFTTLAAKKASTKDAFQDYHTQQLSNGGPLKLEDVSYDKLTRAPRDYSVAVLLTALEARFGCELCNKFQPDWELLGKQWAKGDKKGESRLVFGTLDFLDGRQTFQSMALQTAPVLLLFQPTIGPHAKPDGEPIRYDFNTGSSTADPIHTWLSNHLPDRPHPPFVRPLNYFLITISITGALGAITFGALAYPYVLPYIQSRNLWAAISLILVLLFTSGHMYNHIRSVPYIASDSKGKINYFAGGFQSQFGLETQIIAAIYGVLAFASISLALKVPRMSDPRYQQGAVFLWSATILIVYSLLISIFKIKNGGYPFWLPPF